MSGRLRVGLVFGGASVEPEVSVVSARGVAAGFDAERIECIPLAVTEEGRWLSPTRSGVILAGDDRVVRPGPEDDGVRLVADPGGGGLWAEKLGARPEPVPLDAAFPVIHGWGGEDGRLQALLDLAAIPYVGAGVLGSALAMDKGMTKAVLAHYGLPVGSWIVMERREFREDPEATVRRAEEAVGLPAFVKPSNGGSSVGITRVDHRAGMRPALDAAFACDRRVVVEKAVDAREIECAVLGGPKPRASVPGEIVPSREFYDYRAKYEDDSSRLLIPAPLEEHLADTVRDLALAAFRVLALEGMARVDFLVERRTGRTLVNEVNTLPGFTPISMYPKLWEASGLPYPRLLEELVHLAVESARERADRLVRRPR